MRSLCAALFAAVACALSAAPPALAKEGVVATLENPALLTRAQGGEHLRIAFAMNVAPRLPILDPQDRVPPHPFGASGVYVRVQPAKSGSPLIVSADPPGDRGYPAGRYVADVTVPAGGIRSLAIGLEGYQYVERRAPRRSDVFFAMANDPFVAARAGAHARVGTSVPWGLFAGGLVVVTVLLVRRAWGLRRAEARELRLDRDIGQR